ncbi:MAG: SurA N-terminal domain-containing protein [Pseudomonadales bacterium]|jgi:peptidyl-prolyl cis-trans isomerase D
MLQKIRNNTQGIAAYFVAGILVIAMAAFGVGPLLDSIGGPPNAAEINGTEIAEPTVAIEVQRQKQQLYQSGVSDISDDVLREEVLDRLIGAELLTQAAEELNLAVSKGVIDQQIVTNPAFAGIDGYDPNTFSMRIAQLGYTPQEFVDALSRDYTVQQYFTGLTNTAFLGNEQIAALVAIIEQSRSFEYGVIDAADTDGIVIDEETLEARYNENLERFLTEAQMTAQYVKLERAELAASVEVTEEDLQREFEVTQSNVDAQTLKLVAHILVTPKDDGSEAATIADIEASLGRGEDFAELALNYSDDFASAEIGGEIGQTDGTAFDPVFEDALDELAIGEVSGPVETDFGTHFIKLLEVDSAEQVAFEDVRDELEERIRNMEVDRIYAVELESLRDAAYQYGDLESLAEALELTLYDTSAFTLDGGEGMMANAELRATAFANDVREDGLISEVVEAEEGVAVVVAMQNFEPARVMSLDEVRDELVAELTAEAASQRAKVLADTLVERAQSGATLEALFAEEGVEWLVARELTRSMVTVEPEINQAAFKLPINVSGEREYSAVTLPSGRVAVFGLIGVADGSYNPEEAAQLDMMMQFFDNMYAAAEAEALQQALFDNAAIERR